MKKLTFKINQFFSLFRFLKTMGFRSWLIFLKASLLNSKGSIQIKPKEANHKITLRGSFIDRKVFDYVFADKFHLPDERIQLPASPTILDLGSNIGLTICHFQYHYPSARIVGYEMDRENFSIASKNTEPLTGVTVYNAAVWIEDGTIEYSKEAKNDAFTIEDKVTDSSKNVSVCSKSIQSILEENEIEKVDYLKMDIEGAEKEILNKDDLTWLERIEAMNLELHLDKDESIDHYKALLEKQGFKVWVDSRHWSSLMAKR